MTSAADGTYTNTIAAGALQTDLGNSPADATADVTFTTGGSCTQLLLDPGFEATDNSAFPYTNPNWDSTSTNFGTAFCDLGCGDGGGTAGQHAGTFWAWLGGAPAGSPEDATISQAVVIPSGDTRFLNFWLWVGAIGDGSTNLDVSVDGNVVTSFPEPAAAEAGYTQRGIDISTFADGRLAHDRVLVYRRERHGLELQRRRRHDRLHAGTADQSAAESASGLWCGNASPPLIDFGRAAPGGLLREASFFVRQSNPSAKIGSGSVAFGSDSNAPISAAAPRTRAKPEPRWSFA